MAEPKTGPLTFEELLALWRSGVDEGYSEPLLRGGDGNGLELTGQMLAQLELVSRAIDETFQSWFISPYSGQTGDPASGPRRSTVELTIRRTKRIDVPLIFLPLRLRAEELADDFGPNGPVPTRTGRVYASALLDGLMPGEDEIPLSFAAERAGRGYDLPLPGTIRAFAQPGARLTNAGASVVPGVASHALVAAPFPDAPAPENVGSYLAFLDGANAGRIVRVSGHAAPPDDGSTGGRLDLAATGVYMLASSGGTFEPGEPIEQAFSGARGVFLKTDGTRFVLDRTLGDFVLAQAVIGQRSGATATFDAEETDPDLVAETGTAEWRILSWADDLGMTVSNALSPAGGRAAMLDEIGFERDVPRDGDSDDVFRERVAFLPDVVSPNAIRRTVNRILAPSGRQGCVREVGYEAFRGLFYDGDPTSADPAIAFAYDMDFDVRPQDRFKLRLDYAEFRAFFLVGIPPSDEGEFGIAYDAGATNAYDAAPWLSFYDGFPIGAAAEAIAIWRAVDKARAYGVGFDFYRDDRGDCPAL